MNIGAAELLILLIGVVPFAVIVWGILDAAMRPDPVWQRAGQSKVLWVALQVAGLFVCLAGLILSLVYLFAIRPQLARYQGRGGFRDAGY